MLAMTRKTLPLSIPYFAKRLSAICKSELGDSLSSLLHCPITAPANPAMITTNSAASAHSGTAANLLKTITMMSDDNAPDKAGRPKPTKYDDGERWADAALFVVIM